MSRSQRFLGGLTLNYGYQAIVMVGGLWLTPFFLHRLGQHAYGLWLVCAQLLTYLTLTDFGVVALLPLETAYATGRAGGSDKTDELPELIGRTTRLVFYQLPVVVAVAVAMWFATPSNWQELRGPLAVVLAGFVISFPLRILPAILLGLQDLSFTSAMQIANWTLSTAVSVVMIFGGWSLYALAYGWLVSQTALTPFYFYRLWKRFPGVLPRRLPAWSWNKSKAQLGNGFWINVSQVAQLLMSNTDLLIIGKLLGPEAVVPYACTGKLVNVLANQANILMHTATPGLCELKSGESREKLFQVLVALNHGMLTYSGLVFCMVLLVNKWFVTWWVTAGEYGGFALNLALLVNMVFGHWNTTAAYSVFCFGHQRRISLTNLAQGLVTAGTSYGLTMKLGAIGAVVGSILGTCLVGLPWNLWIIAEDTGSTVRRLCAAMLTTWSWRFALMGGAVLWVASEWSPRTMIEAGAALACIATVYLLVMAPGVMRSPLGNYVRPVLASFRGKYAAALSLEGQ